MRKTKLLAIICLASLSILVINELKSNFVLVNPIPADPFEYEFELLNGQVIANPYGVTK
ncbi:MULTISPECIES: hypothetical protein [Paenibacillus]|uniref:Uncharacterized protein n=1 Tax=Paenibacillus radicis (ex Xue et al. 2023) TaxID=2972489 RepID=A0ABT1YQ65_9BACL|nr:hypothetical protein [Paenibacillus radicis (ex Xue et al. 2023)]MCR8634880.1 hypothetical protein [Paenibacillus radicis (ex Xue et al. 2023)]